MNGVFHRLQSFIVPTTWLQRVYETLGQNLSHFQALLLQHGLRDTIDTSGPITIFCPTLDALNTLPVNVRENAGLMKDVLSYHIVSGVNYYANRTDFVQEYGSVGIQRDGMVELPTLVPGASLILPATPGPVVINDDVSVLEGDIFAINGVIHVIDQVLLPP